jgi:GNAT superfamily N-acetyltransferase
MSPSDTHQIPANSHPSPAPNWTWVPIRSLGPRHRERITAHLLALDVNDRFLRFGYPATDAQISKYVDMLDFEQDEVFGIFSRRLELIAMAHLAHAVPGPGATGEATSEFGVSVLPHARARGFGRRLFEHAMLHARNRGVETLFIHALSENTAMLKIARNAGATVVREGSESDAWLKLPPDTLGSHVGELVEHQAAELDYRLKRHARQVTGILDVLGEVKTSLNKAVKVAQE